MKNLLQNKNIYNLYKIDTLNIDSKIENPSHGESMIKNEEYDKI